MLAMDSPMPTTLFPILTLYRTSCHPHRARCHLCSSRRCLWFPLWWPLRLWTSRLPLPKRLNARSVRLILRPPPRLTLRPKLPLMLGTDTTDIPAIMVDTTAVDTMEAGEDITDTLTDTDTDTDGANRQKKLHHRPTYPIINHSQQPPFKFRS